MNFKGSLTIAAAALAAVVSAQTVVLKKTLVPAALAQATKIGHTNPNKTIYVTVGLPYGDPAGMQAYADSVSNPNSPNFRNFLAPEEIGTRFGLSDDKVQAVELWMKSKGFAVTMMAKNHLTITGKATVQQAEAAFGTVINDYQFGAPQLGRNQKFYSFSKALMMPTDIAPNVISVSGMDNISKPEPLITTLTPAQARNLYGLAPIYGAGFRGQGRTVAISNWDGFRLSNIAPFCQRFGLPSPAAGFATNCRVIPINGANGQTITAGGEADLDIQMVIGQVPLCNLLVYDNAGDSDHIGVISKEADDNQADIISESWEWRLPDDIVATAHNIHLAMTAQGITYLEASGDTGANIGRGFGLNYPHYDGEVLSVGGTVATVDAVGNRVSEVTWVGGGGGWATDTNPLNVRPSWQKGNGVLTTVNRRLLPDVALQAGNIGATGAYFFVLNGQLHGDFSGTSFAGPVFAGQLAGAQQRAIFNGLLPANRLGKRRTGRLQDLIYIQNGRSDIWHDITQGNNGVLPNGSPSTAKPGWDTATGWGAINWNAMSLQTTLTQKINGAFLSVNEGTPLNGSGNALSQDGVYFRITPATVAGLGQVASASYQFVLPTNISRSFVQSIDYTIITKYANGTTGQLFLFNYTTGKWDLMRSYPTSATATTLSVSLGSNLTTYVTAAGQYRVLVRGLLPSSGGVTGNSFDEDYVNTTVHYLPAT